MAEPYSKGFPVSWDQLHRDGRALAWRVADMGSFEGSISITRGGLVPAAIVARELDIRLVDTLCVSSYDHQDQSEVHVIKGIDGDGAGWLIIDDLVDTGKTARVVRKMLPKAHFACVYAKPLGKPLVDSYITEVSQDTWSYFPWDTDLQFVPPIAGDEGQANNRKKS